MAPLAWIRRVRSEIPEMNEIPLFGNAPPFDLLALAIELASRFGIAKLAIHSREHELRDGQIGKGLGAHLLTLSINIAPLGTVFWMMSREDVVKLTSWLMKSGGRARALTSEILQEGFYRYLALESLYAMQGHSPFKELTLQISEEEGPASKAICIDYEIEIDHKSCWGRLAIPLEFKKAWVHHFSHFPSEYIPAEIARQTMLSVGIKTGSVRLSQEEWENISKGDFVLLDQGSYDPRHQSGHAALMLQSTPLFNVHIKKGQIELADYAFTHEDSMKREDGEVTALKELPLNVTVEVARLKITLEKLMQLSPGNTIDLQVDPDQGVALTISGQIVGRAELVYLGEKLGLRILEIGS